MKFTKIKNSETLIYKALEKLDMLELFTSEETGKERKPVPIRATKAIKLHHLDLQIPEGTLFFITLFQWDTVAYPKSFELQLAFPDEEKAKNDGHLVYKRVPCKVDSTTYEILLFDNMSLSEFIEKVDNQTAETMMALYSTECKFDEHKKKYDDEYNDTTSTYAILLTGLIPITSTFLLCALYEISIFSILSGICGGFILGLSIAYIMKYFKKDYETTDDAKTLKVKMAEMCKSLEGEETLACG